MCGLILAPQHFAADIDRALSAMGYRGPNSWGSVSIGQWVIGHVRLAIQDLSPAGHQPFTNDHSVTAFVGEFFTHGDMSERDYLNWLLQEQSRFYEADGFWSVVQASLGSAIAMTDHLGIKPLYYWREHNIVCSELEAMFELSPRPALDEIYLSNCIKFGYDYSGRTPYEGIMQLPAGHVLSFDENNQPWLQRYWDWSQVRRPTRPLNLVLEDAISNRLLSDRPVAMLLSGGLDSSIIYYTLKRMGRQVEVFSVENGESEFLPEGVATLDLPDVSPREALEVMQAPLDLGSLLPQIRLARAIEDAGYKVCITGDGADELFGGYRRAMQYDSQHSDTFCELPYYHLPRLDRVMMRSTIELRSPFLAPSVVAAALALPYLYRTRKQALKHAFSRVVPKAILERDKHPLKSKAVLDGGMVYRAELVQEFRRLTEEKSK